MCEPWERQDYDTEESWPLFVAYRDQTRPRRGVLSAFRGRPVDPVKVARWYREFFWKERAAAYDDHLDEIRRAEIEAMHAEQAREVAAKHMALLADAREVSARELQKLLARAQESQLEILKPRDLIRLMETTVRFDRLVRGESTDNIDTGPDLSHVDDERLAEIERLLQSRDDDADPARH